MTSLRPNGEGSISAYRNGFAACIWITTPLGKRQRKYVYGRTREIVHGRWWSSNQANQSSLHNAYRYRCSTRALATWPARLGPRWPERGSPFGSIRRCSAKSSWRHVVTAACAPAWLPQPGPLPAAPHWPMSEITDFDERPPLGTTVFIIGT